MKNPIELISQVEWLGVRNSEGTEAPASAILRIVSVDADGTIGVGMANAVSMDPALLLVNGPVALAAAGDLARGDYGQAHRSFPCGVLYDSLSGTPTASALPWGTTAGSWKLSAHQLGFYSVGGVGADIANFQATVLGGQAVAVKVTSVTPVGAYYPAITRTYDGAAFIDGVVCYFLPLNGETPILNNQYGACVPVYIDPASGRTVYSEDFGSGGAASPTLTVKDDASLVTATNVGTLLAHSPTFVVDSPAANQARLKAGWGSAGDIQAVANVASAGTSEKIARADHVHVGVTNVTINQTWTNVTLVFVNVNITFDFNTVFVVNGPATFACYMNWPPVRLNINADQNDYDPGACGAWFELNVTGTRKLTGWLAGVDGRWLKITNTGGGILKLMQLDGASAVANQFDWSAVALNGGSQLWLYENDSAEFMYDGTAALWMLQSTAGQHSHAASSFHCSPHAGAGPSAWRPIAWQDVPDMVGSGVGHAPGLAPDPPAVAGTAKYLREDGTWFAPPGTLAGFTRQTFNAATYTVVGTADVMAGLTAAVGGFVTVTLPAAAGRAGQVVVVVDEAGGVTPTNYLLVVGGGADTIAAAAYSQLKKAYGMMWFQSDGVSDWVGRREQVFGPQYNGLAPAANSTPSGENFLAETGLWLPVSQPMTTLGDMLYEDATPAPARLLGNTSTAKKFLRSTGVAGLATAPAWDTLAAADLPAHNLLSLTHGDTLADGVVLGDLLAGNTTPLWSRLPGDTSTTKKFLTQTGTGTASAVPAWGGVKAVDLAGEVGRTLEFYRFASSLSRYEPAAMVTAASALTPAMSGAANDLWALPYVSPRGGTADRIAFITQENWSGMGASPKVRLGIYDNIGDTEPYPNARIVDVGEILLNVGTGLQALTINQALAAGALYWVVIWFNASSIGWLPMAFPISCAAPLIGCIGNTSPFSPGIGWKSTSPYGANLPATFPQSPSAATVWDTNFNPNFPGLYLRFSA